MKKKTFDLLLLTLGLLFWVCNTAAAQTVNVLATVDRNTLGTEEPVRLTLEIQGASFTEIEIPPTPEYEGLALVQPVPSTRRNVSIVNGRMHQSVAYEWVFRPVREGSARIKPIEVTISGRSYRTGEITLNVVPQSRRPQRTPGQSNTPFAQPFPPDGADDDSFTADEPLDENDLFIRAIPSARSTYQNSQVTIEYQLFFRNGIQLRQSRLADSWDAGGFWREEMEVDPRPLPRTVVEKGLRYHSIVLKRVSVFPTRTGTLTVDPLRIETEAYFPRRTNDVFGQFFSPVGRFEQVELSSPAVTIESRPLPGNAPASFRGAVGNFTMSSRINRNDVSVGESVELSVIISGDGNVATLEAPQIQWPGAFEVYDPQVSTNINRNGTRVRGEKTFTFIAVPRTNGTFEVPPVEFSYFDPSASRYVSLNSAVGRIRVTGSATSPELASTTASGLPVDDIAGIISEESGWIRTARQPLHTNPWTYAVLFLPLLGVAGVFAYRKHTSRIATDHEYARNRRAHPVARKHLKRAGEILRRNDPQRFYEELERAVTGFVGNRLNIAESGLTRHQFDLRLEEVGVSDDVRVDLQRFLEECDRGRFAPISPDRSTLEEAYRHAAALITRLNEHFNRLAVSAAGRP